MATTTTKDGNNGEVAKPRRGASPSSDSGIGTRRGGPLSSEKPVPNYLRPTISSRGDTPKEVKKKTLSSPDNRKPVLARRSSFERPPAVSHLQKIISTSPGERSVTVRSSSFSGRTGTLQRPASERTSMDPSRTSKVVSGTPLGNNVGGKAVARKSSPAAAASSSLVAKNKEKPDDATAVVLDDASRNDNSGISSVGDSEKVPSPTKEEKEEVPEPAEAENNIIEHEVPEVIVNEELHHDVVHSGEYVADKEEIRADNGIIPASKEDDHKNSTVVAQPQAEEVHEEIKDKEQIVPDDPKGEDKEVEAPKAVPEQAKAEAEDKKEDKPVVEEADVAAKEEKEVGDAAENAEDSAIVTSGNDRLGEVKEAEAVNVEEEKQVAPASAEKTAAKQRSEKPATAGATATAVAQANNDIIEETTKKLMESSRKNKVKALAGAFETVISLEKPGQG